MIIEVKELKKRFGRFEALRDVTFSVPKGKTAGFLGPNGSGKTTTIKVLVGLLRRDGGEVRVLGMDPWKQEVDVKSALGVLHEVPVYPKSTSVRTLLKYLAKLRGYGMEEVERVARLTGITDYLDKRVGSLSRGYLQRLGLAQSLLGDPEILLLDEPTANLDPLARIEILRLIKLLKRELGVTVLISSHILPELKEVCDYAVFISGGVTLDWGTLDELASKYGVVSSYVVRVERARELATHLISLDFVNGVELLTGGLLVKVNGRVSEELMQELDRIRAVYGITAINHHGSELGDLYERVVKAKA